MKTWSAVNSESPTIYIRSTYELIRVDLNEVEYIESVENYIRIHFYQWQVYYGPDAFEKNP